MTKTHNFLTFDIEEWYNANFRSLDHSSYNTNASNLESNVERLIDICDEFEVKSTCFILGRLGETKPGIIKKLHNAGHEIACHSYNHKLVYEMSAKEFYDDTKKACSILEDLTGEKIVGYRAPSWSVNENVADWYYDTLNEQGFLYSSSIYPSYTYLYGLPGFPRRIHFPVINGSTKKVLEIPQTLIKIAGKSVGYSGGFFLRVFPSWYINRKITKNNKLGKNVFVYLHPHEIDTNLPKAKLGKVESLILYWNIKNTESKLKKIVDKKKETFVTMNSFVDNFKG